MSRPVQEAPPGNAIYGPSRSRRFLNVQGWLSPGGLNFEKSAASRTNKKGNLGIIKVPLL